jgi:hypothetical protein
VLEPHRSIEQRPLGGRPSRTSRSTRATCATRRAPFTCDTGVTPGARFARRRATCCTLPRRSTFPGAASCSTLARVAGSPACAPGGATAPARVVISRRRAFAGASRGDAEGKGDHSEE